MMAIFSSVWATCVLLSYMAIGCGRVQPAGNSNLGLCEGIPCFKGITPGATRWSEAQTIFASLASSQVFDTTIVYNGPDSSLTIYLSADGMTVGTIAVVIASDARLAVSDVIRQYGNPYSVSFYFPTDAHLTLHYPLLSISTQLSGNHLTEDTPIRYITFFDPAPLANLSGDPCRSAYMGLGLQVVYRPWRGFTSLPRYMAER